MLNRSILLVCSEFPPMPGGIGNHAYNLAIALAKHGYRVRVLTNKRVESEEQYHAFIQANPSIEIHMVPRSTGALTTYAARIKAYGKLLKQEASDVIFSGKFSIWLAALGWHKKRAWAIIHGSEIKQSGIKRWWFKKGISKINGLISVSTFTEESFFKAFPTFKQKHHWVINNGFNLSGMLVGEKPTPLPQTCRIITVGGMHPRKGQQNIIAALPEIKKKFSQVQYTIAGLPNHMSTLKTQAEQLGVANHVHFVVSPETPELIRLLHESDIFAMLSENLPNGDIEGFGIAILEGMSLGLPAIGSANSGIRDAIDHQVSGILIQDIHNTQEIAQAIGQIMERYDVYSAHAITWSDNFKWEKVIQKYLTVFEQRV